MASEDTNVKETYFQMTLPGKWSGAYDKEARCWNFLCDDGCKQLTVSVMISSKPVIGDRQLENLEMLLKARRESEVNSCPNPVKLTETVSRRDGSTVVARYDGGEPRPPGPESARFFACLIMMNETVACVFYLETCDLPYEALQKCAHSTFNSIVISDANHK